MKILFVMLLFVQISSVSHARDSDHETKIHFIAFLNVGAEAAKLACFVMLINVINDVIECVTTAYGTTKLALMNQANGDIRALKTDLALAKTAGAMSVLDLVVSSGVFVGPCLNRDVEIGLSMSYLGIWLVNVVLGGIAFNSVSDICSCEPCWTFEKLTNSCNGVCLDERPIVGPTMLWCGMIAAQLVLRVWGVHSLCYRPAQ